MASELRRKFEHDSNPSQLSMRERKRHSSTIIVKQHSARKKQEEKRHSIDRRSVVSGKSHFEVGI